MRKPRAVGTTPLASSTPSRLYSLLATNLGTFMLCLTLWSIANLNGSHSVNATDTGTLATSMVVQEGDSAPSRVEFHRLRVPDQKLAVFAILSALAGVIVALPRRRLSEVPKVESTLDLGEAFGVPIMASLFPVDAPPVTPQSQRQRTPWITRVVFLAEIIICTSFVIALMACYQQRSLARTFVQHPFDAYVSSVKTTIHGVESLLRHDSDTAALKS